MVIVRFGPASRRWLAVAAAGGVLVGLLRWGLAGGTGGSQAVLAGTSVVDHMAVAESVVALTVDAPTGSRMAPLAQALAAAGLPVTMFVDGGYAKAHPEPLRALGRTGDEIEVLDGANGQDLASGVQAVADASGQVPLFVRPAEGRAASALLRPARKDGLAVVTSTVGPAAAADLLGRLAPGDIVRLQPANTSEVGALAAGLRAKGYQAVTLEALMAMSEGAANVSLPTVP